MIKIAKTGKVLKMLQGATVALILEGAIFIIMGSTFFIMGGNIKTFLGMLLGIAYVVVGYYCYRHTRRIEIKELS